MRIQSPTLIHQYPNLPAISFLDATVTDGRPKTSERSQAVNALSLPIRLPPKMLVTDNWSQLLAVVVQERIPATLRYDKARISLLVFEWWVAFAGIEWSSVDSLRSIGDRLGCV